MTDTPLLSLWRGEVSPPPAAFVRVSKETRDRVLAEVCQSRPKMKPEDILAGSRARPIAHAKQEAMWRLRQVTWENGAPRYSLPAIASALNLKDHTTVLWGCRQHAKRLAEQ